MYQATGSDPEVEEPDGQPLSMEDFTHGLLRVACKLDPGTDAPAAKLKKFITSRLSPAIKVKHGLTVGSRRTCLGSSRFHLFCGEILSKVFFLVAWVHGQ